MGGESGSGVAGRYAGFLIGRGRGGVILPILGVYHVIIAIVIGIVIAITIVITQFECSKTAKQLVALAGIGAEGHIAIDDLGVILFLGFEIE